MVIGMALRKLCRYAYYRLTMRAYEEGLQMGKLLAALPPEDVALWTLDAKTNWSKQ